jgi:hypothetical protein
MDFGALQENYHRYLNPKTLDPKTLSPKAIKPKLCLESTGISCIYGVGSEILKMFREPAIQVNYAVGLDHDKYIVGGDS